MKKLIFFAAFLLSVFTLDSALAQTGSGSNSRTDRSQSTTQPKKPGTQTKRKQSKKQNEDASKAKHPSKAHKDSLRGYTKPSEKIKP